MSLSERLKVLTERYEAAAHAVQSGVAMEMSFPGEGSATEPKHLRVGINLRASDHAALATLLIHIGLITEEEYLEALVQSAEKERESYEARLSARLGRTIKLR